jgi:hypothetical protein
MYIPLTFEGALAKCLYASGGYEGYFISGSDEYKYHWFDTGSKFTVLAGTLDNVSIFLCGAGGAGGYSPTVPGQGGGGGEFKLIENVRIFGGDYFVSIGGGGMGASSSVASIGGNGYPTSISGANFYYSASGGEGGSYFGYIGGALGTSGNGFAGGANVSAHGGGGGGATQVGYSGGATAPYTGDGGDGYEYILANIPVNNSILFGCGGGGGNSATSTQPGNSCIIGYGGGANATRKGQLGTPNYGGGGGGGRSAAAAPSQAPGDGGSGSLYIQYKINSYCKNYFNKPGDCGCVQRKFEYDYSSGFFGDLSASYMYVPCGTSTMISGSIDGYLPRTVCIQSGTFYYGPLSASAPETLNDQANWIYGFATGGVECSTGSVCGGIPQYESSCSSSFYTYINESDVNVNPIWYVARNQSTMSVEELPVDMWPTYRCLSTILSNISGSLPNTVTKYDGARNFGVSWAYTQTALFPNASATLHWYDSAGIEQTYTLNYPTSETYFFTASFALGNPYVTVVNTNRYGTLTLLSTGSVYSGSGLPTCGCP